ncbi:tRNA (adenosine(37)-N6)-threonylcarbamoyltransferase complex dimerization subunit type 1 TsaB [Brevundimonas sp. S30B]|uniref:tRNA (adenosine(37)-N6)-threonylcarbamoyltransferase complex dimerization subunit type 1 TsaB n=1 Tax=unclassified Brevundimonas TaxID=2622653 RepID=UPI001072E85A|nr:MULTISPECIES: tRNA (adenosine(37)-N6)-threonylcarbamoyltransferase complex dimerization subunit type 1 TsaB [unclassified Brevundimonas]QBX37155.1 tRNA (adenosine(37)-N6)-threonylcarbamoyltransferase complex dimerization subunit type 1 TsaB [Brevundimonas sp. MF30-B]TFW04050.1 tRNA (adenosine(37)-N6)-threonylcarbamoyltransferase complex dimerization subunit type 1 TsaB [Brevundimonas sp. S30B]
MRLMVIDTALGACTAAVFEDGRPLAVRQEVMSKGHQERLGGLARDAMAASGLTFDDLNRIGVTVGPGSFTGLRVGLAFALGLGAALDRPVVGVSALDALAADGGPGLVLAAIDARRGQVYARLFRDGRPLDEARALSLDEARAAIALERLADEPVRLIGSGAALLAQDDCDIDDRPAPSPEALARLTQAASADEPARPLYLRAPDATPPSRKAGAPRVRAT